MKIAKSPSHGKARSWYIPVLLGVMLVPCAQAQLIRAGAQAAALGGGSTVLTGLWAAFSNPALCRGMTRQVGAAWTPAPFGLTELSTAAFVAGMDARFAFVTVSGRREGSGLFHRDRLACTCANPGDGPVLFGASAAWTVTSIQGYGSDGALCLDAGVAVQLSQAVLVAASVQQVNQPWLGPRGYERIPMTIAAGVAWQLDGALRLVADVQKEVRHDATVRAGVEYRPFSVLALRLGTSTDPALVGGGVGVSHGGFSADFGYLVHPDLGGTYSLSIDVFLEQAGL